MPQPDRSNRRNALAVAFAPSSTGTCGGMLTIAAATAQLSGLGTADPGIAISPLALTFANTAGSSATAQSVTLTATGTATLQVGTPTSANAAFQASSACGSLAPRASCTVTVIYTPGDLLTTGALTIPVTSAGQTIEYTVALNGTYANTSAGLAISPAQAVFAPTPTNTIGTTQQITLTNLTTKTFALQVDLPRQFPLAGAPCTALGPGQSCTFAITFVPLTFGPVAGSIVVQAIPTDGSATRTSIAYAEGYGSGSATVSLTGGLIVNNVYNFGQVTSGQSASQTFTVNNAGSAGSPAIHIRRVVSQPPFLATTTCGAPLNPGQTCTITVNYTARNSGQATIPDTGLLTIESDAASSPNLLNLTGVAGVASGSAGSAPLAAYTLSTSDLTFPTTSVGDLSPTQTVTLTNTGSINLHILALATPADFTAQTTCGTVIPGGVCTFSITSTPQTAGPLLGALAITSDSANSLEFLSLLGTGQPSALVITPASLSFAPLLIGATSVLPLQIANSGASPVTLSPLTVSGDFSAACPCVIVAAASGNLAAGATCSAEVTFKPTAAGARGGTLSVTSTASALPLQVSLTGTGLQAFLTATPATVAFPGTVIGTTQTLQLTLSNTGLSAIASIALTASGDYTIASPCPATLAGGASCTVQIAFTPSTAGPRPSTLAVTSSDPGSPLTVPLSGTGLPAPTFTIMVNGGATASANVTSGQPATFPVILTPQNGFTGPVALTCGAIAAAQYASCSINPALPSLTAGAQPATVTLNTITAANGTARLQVPAGTSLTRTVLCSMFPGLIALWRRRKSLRRRLPVLLAMLCTTISLFVAGCGGGLNGYPASLYTPPGSYQFKVTGSSTRGPAISQTVTLNLTVTAD